MLLYDWTWRGHLNQSEGGVHRGVHGGVHGGVCGGVRGGVHGGCTEGRMEGCVEGLPLATINLVGDNREFEV